MKKLLAIVVLFMMTQVVQAQQVKVYWRCANKHLEVVDHQTTIKGQKIALYVNYQATNENGLNDSPISKTSMVELPNDVASDAYIMLGVKGQWFMNCVGQIVQSPHHPQPKLVFDVSKNAYSCPLIPKSCQASQSQTLLLEDD